MKCLVVSFFNSQNIGDIIISDMLYRKVSKNYVTEKCSYIGTLEVQTDINNINQLKFLNKSKVLDFLKKSKLISKAYIYKKKRKKDSYWKELEIKIKEADLLVIGGGNMIFDINQNSCSASKFNDFINLATKHNKKVFAISIGVGPFQTEKQIIKTAEAIEKCDYVTFRDNESFNIVSDHLKSKDNKFVSIDPVFLLNPELNNDKSSNAKIIGLNIFNSKLLGSGDAEYNELINSYVKLTRKLVENHNVKIILFSTDLTDYVAVEDVYKQLTDLKENVRITNINGYKDLLDLYQNLTLLIGTRMHSMIIAFTQNIPIIGFSWQQKVDAFFKIINQEDSVFRYEYISRDIDQILHCYKNKIINIESEKSRMKIQQEFLKGKWNINDEILQKISLEMKVT